MQNRRRVVYYAILLLLILGELLGERNYIIIIFPEYDTPRLCADIIFPPFLMPNYIPYSTFVSISH